MTTQSYTKVAMADDHVLVRHSLANLIDQIEGFKVILQASNGEELINSIKGGIVPDVLLLDLNMPVMGGRETAEELSRQFPDIQILILTMFDTESCMIPLLKAGVKGFLRKDISTTELRYALNTVVMAGYYHTTSTTGKLINLFKKSEANFSFMRIMLNDTESKFLKLTCSELTYKEIANEMNLNPRAVDNIRDGLFDKLEVKSRVGLAMYSIRNGIFAF